MLTEKARQSDNNSFPQLQHLNPAENSSSALVLDSSAIASLFFKEKSEEQVAQTIRQYDQLSTVDIAYVEIGSVAWKAVMIFKEKIEPSRAALRRAAEFIRDNCDVVPSEQILDNAFELGTEYNLQIYDSLFLCLARQLKTRVLTTDQRLHNKINAIKELHGITALPR